MGNTMGLSWLFLPALFSYPKHQGCSFRKPVCSCFIREITNRILRPRHCPGLFCYCKLPYPHVIAMNGLRGEEAIANYTGRICMAALYSMRLPRSRSQWQLFVLFRSLFCNRWSETHTHARSETANPSLFKLFRVLHVTGVTIWNTRNDVEHHGTICNTCNDV